MATNLVDPERDGWACEQKAVADGVPDYGPCLHIRVEHAAE